MFRLRVATHFSWLAAVQANFDEFLLDHTLCERKASAMGMSLVAKYPNRPLILEPLIEFAREELEHFHIMFKVIHARGLQLPDDTKDIYVNELIGLSRRGDTEALFLDRLLIPGIVEARGCERLQQVAETLPNGELKATYIELIRAEARHHALFFRLARHYFADDVVQSRSDYLLDKEAEIIERLPVAARVH